MQQLSTFNEPRLAWSRRSRSLLLAGVGACLLLLGGSETPARAAFPVTNGKIAFSTLSDWGDPDIFVMNADGLGLVALNSYGADDF